LISSLIISMNDDPLTHFVFPFAQLAWQELQHRMQRHELAQPLNRLAMASQVIASELGSLDLEIQKRALQKEFKSISEKIKEMLTQTENVVLLFRDSAQTPKQGQEIKTRISDLADCAAKNAQRLFPSHSIISRLTNLSLETPPEVAPQLSTMLSLAAAASCAWLDQMNLPHADIVIRDSSPTGNNGNRRIILIVTPDVEINPEHGSGVQLLSHYAHINTVFSSLERFQDQCPSPHIVVRGVPGRRELEFPVY
jgi:signal transduction histidine kinase